MQNKIKKEDYGDIFDRIMHHPPLCVFEGFYKQHKEILIYLFFGGMAFFLNIFLFAGIHYMSNINALANNIICWIICVLFQFFTNRTWVFKKSTKNNTELIKQINVFLGGRLFTLVLEEGILAVFITYLQMNIMGVKLTAQIIVILLNYIISKFLVLK